MNSFFSAFDKSSLNQWKDQIIKDLKGKDLSILEFHDSLEEIDYKAFYHQDEIKSNQEVPGNFPYTRGFKTTNNDWSNGAFISIIDDKKANDEALDYLMKGADLLVIKTLKLDCNWETIVSGIQFEFIKVQFDVPRIEDYFAIKELTKDHSDNISFNFDVHAKNSESGFIFTILKQGSKMSHNTFLVNGFSVQQTGATTWQEIAFCLNTGHEILLQLMANDYDIDHAAKLIHFHIGVGSNYFNEIAKFRALRQLWSKIIDAYNPSRSHSYNCDITAVIGHLNKSLRDPYTNLLRQTTETMSASNGGADQILVLPYDLYSKEGVSEISKRTALNISLILKEESYLDKVIDPTGGSYSIESLTLLIAEKAWGYFQSIEKNGGLFTNVGIESFTNDIKAKRKEKIDAFLNGSTSGVGMNKYPDPMEKPSEWLNQQTYLGIEPILFDMESKSSLV